MAAITTQRRRGKSVAPDATVAEAARLMLRRKQRSLNVYTRGRVIGTLNLHDLIVRTTAEGRDPNATSVCELMSPLRGRLPWRRVTHKPKK